MSDSRLPTEVELVYEVMPCNAMRTSQEPLGSPHPCSYFRKWGAYHSFDYLMAGPPPTVGIAQPIEYMGRAALLPELLSGCRKAPIIAVGINPNLPGWYPNKRGALNPLFDEYKQYAHYFRYRSTAKLLIPPAQYQHLGGGPTDTPFSNFVLNVPIDAQGHRVVDAVLDEQSMYRSYEGLLKDLATAMHWDLTHLSVGEDIAYANMVACPSARWTTTPIANDPQLPPMTTAERNGIVTECFRERKYFLRQLFQSLPQVLIIFSQNTANAFVSEMAANFTKGNPQLGESVDGLLGREIRMSYGKLGDGTNLEARVIFSPHITGNPGDFNAARQKVLNQLIDEAQHNRLRLNPATGHLQRSRGACVFCTMLEIGKCDYEQELQPISLQPGLLSADSGLPSLLAEKQAQQELLVQIVSARSVQEAWHDTDDTLE